MNIVGKLLGSDKVIDKAAQGIDKVFFTNEEKAESWLNVLKAYEPFKLAQRIIAFAVTGVYLWFIIIAGFMLMLSYWYAPMRELSAELASIINNNLELPFALIIGFYFAGGMGEGLISKYKNQKK